MRVRGSYAYAMLASGVLLSAGLPGAGGAAASAAPQATSESPSAQARRTGQSVEVPEHTSPTQRIVANPDGTFSAELSALPVRMRTAEGDWAKIDPTLVRRSDGSIGPVATPVDITVGGGGSDALVAVGRHADRLGLRWPGTLPEPRLAGATATYADVLPGVDLVARTTATGFATYVVVKTPEAARNPRLESIDLLVDDEGADVVERPDGTLAAQSAAGHPVLESTPALMWDSRGLRGSAKGRAEALVSNAAGSREAAVRTRVTPSGDIRLRPDLSLLRGKADFPVVIDPAWNTLTRGDAAWTMVWSNGSTFHNSSTEHARVGYDGWSSAPKKARSFFRYDIPAVLLDANVTIDKAYFRHLQTHSPNWTCNLSSYGPGVQIWRTEGFSSSTDWPGPAKILQLNGNASETHAAGHETSCDPVQQEWGVTTGVKDAVAANKPNVTFGLYSANEGDRDGWRKYDNTSSFPSLTVTYNHKPEIAEAPTASGSTVANPAPTEAVYTNDPTPSFTVQVDDGDDHAVTVCFTVERTDGVDVRSATCKSGVGTAASAWTTVTSVATSPALPDGTYRVFATANDGIAGTVTSARRTFTVDTIGPPLPTVTFTPPANGWVRDDAAGTATFTSSADAKTYRYVLNGAQPTCAVGTLVTADSTGAATVSIVASWPNENTLRVIGCDRHNNPSAVASAPFVAQNFKQVHRWLWDGTEAVPPGTDAANPGDASLALADNGTPAAGRTDGKNAVTAEPPGTDKALLLSGSAAETQYAATTAAALTGLTKYTITAWVKVDAAWSGTEGIVAAQTGASTNAAALGVSNTGWFFRVGASDAVGSTGTTASLTFDQAGCAPGVWCFLAGTWDGRAKTLSLRVYDRWVTTLASSPTAIGTGQFATTAAFQVGAGRTSTGVNGSFLPGAVDAVRVFAGAPDDSEIDDIAAQTAG